MPKFKKPRITPIDAKLQEPLKSKMARIFPPDRPAPHLYLSVAKNESLFIDMIDMGFITPTGLMDRRTIPSRLRELLILRTCAKAGNDYEFDLHVKTISGKMGLSKPEIEDLKNPDIDDDLWPTAERALIAMTDELVQNISLTDEVFERLSGKFSEAELIEMVQLVGLYTTVAMMVGLIHPEPDSY
jgi:4-carboxymuconolactone decarboxylase